MQIYLVGGAVRDALLKRPVKDKDWVVVGANVEDMTRQGFQQVGKDFPVFLHPQTKEEYALARTERKIGKGYTGFATDSSANVTLEADLLRRDLTINAMAQDENGEIIDPYHGLQDLHNRLLRHVSGAFVEDPLRVLRVARFAARYKAYGFTVAEETLALMTQICQSGELQSLSAERVWTETARALSESHPQTYFETLQRCGGLDYWFAELAPLWGIPNPEEWHPEVDTGVHVMMVLQQAAALSDSIGVRLAALLHDVGKGWTPEAQWPKHHGHEKAGLPLVDALTKRIKAPKAETELAKLVCEHHGNIHNALNLNPKTVVSLFDKTDAWRKPERFAEVLLACEADAKGRLHFEQAPYPQREFLWQCLQLANNVDIKSILAQGLKGPAIKEAIYYQRVQVVKAYKESLQNL